MKSLSLICVMLAVSIHALDWGDSKMRENAEACAKETGVDLETLRPKTNPPDPKLFQRQEYKCFTKCFAVKNEWFTEDGECNLEKLKEKIPNSSKVPEVAKRCSEQNQQQDICDKIFMRQMCILAGIQ